MQAISIWPLLFVYCVDGSSVKHEVPLAGSLNCYIEDYIRTYVPDVNDEAICSSHSHHVTITQCLCDLKTASVNSILKY